MRPSSEPHLRERRRHLRQEATPAEELLWRHLRRRQLLGVKFRRQHPLDPYILDFYCPARSLAIELDGSQHFDLEAVAYDERRSQNLAARGITVIRFTNDKVFEETESVLEAIVRALDDGRETARARGRKRRGKR